MGRSFYRPSPANTLVNGSPNNTFYHKPSDSYFTMLRREGKFYQRRYQIGPDGRQINVMEKQADFVMGSGSHARAYLHRTSRNTLVELPLGWYAEKGGYWAMNPGYDRLITKDSAARSLTTACSATTDIQKFRRDTTSRLPSLYTRIRCPKGSTARGATARGADTRSWQKQRGPGGTRYATPSSTHRG